MWCCSIAFEWVNHFHCLSVVSSQMLANVVWCRSPTFILLWHLFLLLFFPVQKQNEKPSTFSKRRNIHDSYDMARPISSRNNFCLCSGRHAARHGRPSVAKAIIDARYYDVYVGPFCMYFRVLPLILLRVNKGRIGEA